MSYKNQLNKIAERLDYLEGKVKYKLKSLVLEKEDGTLETVEVDMENVEISIENGLRISHSNGSYVPVVESNGMRRMKILAASGCRNYDAFITDAK